MAGRSRRRSTVQVPARARHRNPAARPYSQPGTPDLARYSTPHCAYSVVKAPSLSPASADALRIAARFGRGGAGGGGGGTAITGLTGTGVGAGVRLHALPMRPNHAVPSAVATATSVMSAAATAAAGIHGRR